MKNHETHLTNKGFSVAIFVDVLLWRWFGNWWFSVDEKVLGTWPTETWGNSMCFKEKERELGLIGGVITILKNDGVRQWEGWHPIYEMENFTAMFESTNQGIISLVTFLPEHPQLLDLLVTVSLSHYWNLRCHDFSVCEPSKAVLVVSHESIATKNRAPFNQFETNPVKSPVLMLNSPLVDWLTSHRVSTELRSSIFTGELSNFTAEIDSSVLGYPPAVWHSHGKSPRNVKHGRFNHGKHQQLTPPYIKT